MALEGHRFADCLAEVDEALVVARERGDRVWEQMLLGQSIGSLVLLGRWDAAVQTGETFLDHNDQDAIVSAAFLASVAATRYTESLLQRCRAAAEPWLESANLDLRCCAMVALARASLHDDDPARALELARVVLGVRFGTAAEIFAEAYGIGVEAALELGDDAAMSELAGWVDDLPPARAGSLLRAGRAHLLAGLAHREGDPAKAAQRELEGIDILRTVGARPLLAQAQLDRVRRRDDPDALAEARAIATELGAVAWLDIIDRSDQPAAATTPLGG